MSNNAQIGEQNFIPASMVQNILEWQRQALETIREQNKVNHVTQRQNNALIQKIDMLQHRINDSKPHDKDLMDLDNVMSDTEDIKEKLGDNPRGSSSNDVLFIKDISTKLRHSPNVLLEIERRKHLKALEDLNDEWHYKYTTLQTKFETQHKAYQELKEHYQKRSVEWKRVKKWLDEQKYALKNPECTNESTNKDTKVQFEKSPTIIHDIINDSKTGALTEVTNTRNQSSLQNLENVASTDEHVSDVNKALILGSSYNKGDDDVFCKDNIRTSHDILSSPNLLPGSMLKNDLDKTHNLESKPIYHDRDWNQDYVDLRNDFDHNMINSSNKKRTIDKMIKQEEIENDELFSAEVTNKRYKPLTVKPRDDLREEFEEDEEFDEVHIRTPYSDRFKPDSKRSHASTDDMYEDNDADYVDPLIPITPPSIVNKCVTNNNSDASKQGEGYRYIETVRKKNERRQLMAQDCRDCRKYYEMTGFSMLRTCDHSQSSVNDLETLIQNKKQLLSRHRAKYSRPQTPPGFWKVGFPSSQEIAEINELSVKYEREREEQKKREVEFAKSRERRWTTK
ncbi:9497_t:CDS:2 [Funneliformis mosseae]|uniref:9497_t:CDS:1 n=1 Tax=Funneliformis mosseae TaxID=27381 RepID=A0A9N8YPC7_FUNMO|nr:9497_t:CDS:2 [Funneliformis mosseae]